MLRAFEIVKKNMREKNARAMKNFYSKFDMNQKRVGKEHNNFEQLHVIRGEVENVNSNYQICRYVFKFLQLLCEGHNEKLQNLLRDQRESNEFSTKKSINFISTTATLWGSYIKFVNPYCYDLGNMMLDFLIETIQGPCIQNQMELYKNKIIDFSKDFMNDFSNQRDYESRGFNADNSYALDDLISQNIKMLYSLMEANLDQQIYVNMGQNIEFISLISKLTAKFNEVFKDIDFKNPKNMNMAVLNMKIKNRKTFNEETEEAFDIFFFIQTINDRTSIYKDKIKELNGLEYLAYSFFKKHSAHIEIVFKGKSDIHKIYFMIQPACRYLDENEKKYFIDNVKRETPNEKITDFMNQAPRLFDRMDHMSNLRSKCLAVSQNSFKFVRDLCLFIVFVINLFVFVFYQKDVKNNLAFTESVSFTQLFLQISGILHMFFAVLMLIMWLVLNGKLILMDGWRKKFSVHKKNLMKLIENHKGMDAHSIVLSFNKTLIDLTKREKIRMIRFINNGLGFYYSMPSLEYLFQNILFILSNKTFKYFSFYICLSVIAFSGEVVILYSIHLLDIIVRTFLIQYLICLEPF